MNTIILLGFLFVIVGFFVYLITLYNGLVAIKNDIDKSWANIDVLLKQRHDELSKLLDVTKGYTELRARHTNQNHPGPQPVFAGHHGRSKSPGRPEHDFRAAWILCRGRKLSRPESEQ